MSDEELKGRLFAIFYGQDHPLRHLPGYPNEIEEAVKFIKDRDQQIALEAQKSDEFWEKYNDEVVTKKVLEARIDEQENHVMVGSGNVGCQGCYNAVMYNSDRIDTLKGQYEEEE